MTLEAAKKVLTEENKLPDGVTGICVFDIDDCLLKANTDVIKIYKAIDGKETVISTSQFATDKDKEEMGKNVKIYWDNNPPKEGIWFGLREFRDKQKVYDSIVKGTPIIKNLRILDSKIKAGWDVAFLTARGLQSTVTNALDNFLKTKDSNGNFVSLGDKFKKSLSAAVNDDDIKYIGKDDGEKKANVLKNLASKYDRICFVDDDLRNTESAKNANIKTKSGYNLRVVTAHKPED